MRIVDKPARTDEQSEQDARSGRSEDPGAENSSAEQSGNAGSVQPTLLEQMGGVAGLFYSAVPIIVFVLANGVFGLAVGIWSALASAVAITVVRVVRKEPIQPAISGFFGVAIAAFIAYRTGSAKGFFLFGIWASVVYGGAMILSVLVRWPLAGVVWNYLNGAGTAWRKDKSSRFGYDIATLALAAVFAARFVVQRWLYSEDLTGWLAFAKIVMGYPLYALALLVVIWAVRRSDKRIKELEAAHRAEEADVEHQLYLKYDPEYARRHGREPATET